MYSMHELFERASQRDLRMAAEAVVDAAIWRHKLRADTLGGFRDVSEETRLALIEMIYEDPSLTPSLFHDGAWERH